MLRLVKILTFLLILSLGLPSLADDTPLSEVDGLIANNKLAEAETKITAGLKATPGAYGLLVRKSRILSLKAGAESDEGKKVKLFEEAQAVAKGLIEKHPKKAGGYLRNGVSSGKLALYKGILQSRALILAVKSSATKVLELSGATPYEQALAHYLLGRAHLKLAEKPKALRIPLGLGWASKKKGADHLKKAYTLFPSSIPFALDYAKNLNDGGKTKEAKKLLEGIKDLPVADPADPEHKKAAAELLSSL